MLKNVSSNWLQTAASMAVLAVLMPFTLHRLGQEQYGTWLLIASMTSYVGLFILGVPAASVRYIAGHAATGDTDAMNRTIASCAGLYLLMGLVALFVGLGLFVWFQLSYPIPPALASPSRWAFLLVVSYVASSFFLQLPYGILSAHQDFVLRNKVLIASTILRLVLTVVLLTWLPTLLWLAAIQLSCLAFEFTVAWRLCKRRYPSIRLAVRDFQWATVRQIVSFSVYVLLLHAGYQLVFQTDSLVIAKFMSVGQIPPFVVASSLAVYLSEFVVAIAAVVMPRATQLEAQGKHDELKDVYFKWSKLSLSLSLPPILYLLILGPRFVAWWFGEPTFEKSSGDVLRILMLAHLAFLPIRGVALPILIGLGRPLLPAVALLLTGLVNLGLSMALAGPLGLNGVAIGTAIPNVVFALAVTVLACRQLGVSIAEFLGYVYVRAAIGSVPVVALLLWLRYGLDVRGLVSLGISGTAMLIAFSAIWLLFVYRGDRYDDLAGRVRRVVGRLVARA